MRIGDVLIQHLELIGDLTPADERLLQSIKGESRHVGRGEDILVKGERPDHVIVVLDGLLQRYGLTAEGARQMFAVYLPVDAPCLETLHMGVFDNWLAALAPSEIGIIPHREIFRVMDASPNILALIWRDTLYQGSLSREWLLRNSQMPAHARMAHLFCEVMTRARAVGLASGDSCALPMTQQDLGEALGLSPVHVNRTLMMIRATGFLEFERGRLTVLDWKGLVETTEFDDLYLHLTPPARGGEARS